PLQRHFTEKAAGFRAAKHLLKRLRGLREAAALLLHFADLLLNQADLLARVFQLGGDGGLALRGNLRGVRDAVAQCVGDALQALRDSLCDRLNLAAALRLSRAD